MFQDVILTRIKSERLAAGIQTTGMQPRTQNGWFLVMKTLLDTKLHAIDKTIGFMEENTFSHKSLPQNFKVYQESRGVGWCVLEGKTSIHFIDT